ncbi:MAG: phospholipase A [Campylobacter sp.]|uniref:phospholipase A n=1 Tax=Campylobacter sp. TaxID=205 RepID=UPI001B19768A|nr:phospholipase A [Campylobacter sp.]MBO7154690.1 phospholipase A [Campylobacter sp.]
MKKLIFSIFLFYCGFISGFADEFSDNKIETKFSAMELYQKAVECESSGNFKEALKYYKLSAQKLLNRSDDLSLQLASNLEQSLKFEPTLNSKINLDLNSKSQIHKYHQNSQDLKENELFWGITAHQNNYFLPIVYSSYKGSHKDITSEFSISLKKLIASDIIGLNEDYYFAYTQLSWWDIYADSSPFYENNYQPEIYTQIPVDFYNFNHIRLGFLHDSNGKGELESRSWNRIYSSFELDFGKLSLTPRLWLRLPDNEDDNPAIVKYNGIIDLTAYYKLPSGSFIQSIFSNNLRFDNENKSSFELRYLHYIGDGFYIYLSGFSGYGYELVYYKKYQNRIGIGIAFR